MFPLGLASKLGVYPVTIAHLVDISTSLPKQPPLEVHSNRKTVKK
jgi:hypothetical protein